MPEVSGLQTDRVAPRRRVVVTGIGIVSPLGNDPVTFFDSLAAGTSGIRILDRPPSLAATSALGLKQHVGGAVAFDGAAHFPPPRLRMLDRVAQFALVAAAQAVASSRIDFATLDRERAGVFVGTGMGGAQTTDDGYHTLYANDSDRVQPYSVLMAMNNAAAGWLGIEYGLTGPNLTFSTACSSSAVAIGEAAMRIASGDVDVMIAGGSEAPLNAGTLVAWDALKTLAPPDPVDAAKSCKPFAADRGGLVLGEGAAMMVVESFDGAVARGAPILAEIAGYGLVTDSAHITRPSVEGQSATMRRALVSAGMSAGDIGYINAHGTATLANDPIETAAIRAVFGSAVASIPVSSTKSMHGHLLGAAGALEFAATILAMQNSIAPPTINLDKPDAACDLDYVPNVARRVTISAAMSSSFAFGGTCACLIARRL